MVFYIFKEFVENSKKALRARAGRNRNKRPEAQAYDNQGINMADEGPSQQRYKR